MKRYKNVGYEVIKKIVVDGHYAYSTSDAKKIVFVGDDNKFYIKGQSGMVPVLEVSDEDQTVTIEVNVRSVSPSCVAPPT